MENPSYDTARAGHYKSYRPPLHEQILKQGLGDENFPAGLDIGCGLGHSTTLLTTWCAQVTGLDPAGDMLRQAKAHPRVTYLPFDGEHLPFPSHSMDLITFAGAWYYAGSTTMYAEVKRVIKPGGILLVYDFAIELSEVYSYLDILPVHDVYDHDAGPEVFMGEGEFKTEIKDHSYGVIEIFPEQLAHVLLAEDGWEGRLPAADYKGMTDWLESVGFSGNIPYKTYLRRFRRLT